MFFVNFTAGEKLMHLHLTTNEDKLNSEIQKSSSKRLDIFPDLILDELQANVYSMLSNLVRHKSA